MGSVSLIGLKAYWKHEESSGSHIDIHGGHDFTNNNAAGSRAGVIGNGVDLDGVNQYLSVANDPDLQSGNVEWWVNTWVIVDDKTTSGQIFTRRDSGSKIEFFIFHNAIATADSVNLAVYNGAGVLLGGMNINPMPAVGALFMLSVWHDPATSKVFMSVNNQATPAEDTLTGNMGVGTISTRIGAIGVAPSEFINGMVDETAWFKRKPVGDDLKNMYSGGKGLAYPLKGASQDSRVMWNRRGYLGLGSGSDN